MSWTLYYADLVLDGDIPYHKFKKWENLVDFVDKKVEDDKNVVYLYQYGGLENPIVITHDEFYILALLSSDDACFRTRGCFEHHIHEYGSYEEAYKAAATMMEPHYLGCS